MNREFYKLKRLYINKSLFLDEFLDISESLHYVKNVLRLKEKDELLIFNQNDGEFLAEIDSVTKKNLIIHIKKQTKLKQNGKFLGLIFAPIKGDKLNLVIEKAVELGVTDIICIKTRHCVVKKLNIEKLERTIIEASEQSERIDIPSLKYFEELENLIYNISNDAVLYFADEQGGDSLKKTLTQNNKKNYIMIGPEGGFHQSERDFLRSLDCVKPISLGPRILKAETASIAAVAIYQAIIGDFNA